jgi:hypothetical protein
VRAGQGARGKWKVVAFRLDGAIPFFSTIACRPRAIAESHQNDQPHAVLLGDLRETRADQAKFDRFQGWHVGR